MRDRGTTARSRRNSTFPREQHVPAGTSTLRLRCGERASRRDAHTLSERLDLARAGSEVVITGLADYGQIKAPAQEVLMQSVQRWAMDRDWHPWAKDATGR